MLDAECGRTGLIQRPILTIFGLPVTELPADEILSLCSACMPVTLVHSASDGLCAEAFVNSTPLTDLRVLWISLSGGSTGLVSRDCFEDTVDLHTDDEDGRLSSSSVAEESDNR